ncbi:Com family DNA-binding transcriptional regulator [Herbaspirillum lusitanum]|uniref:Com family DNA-binding transcriptional regulator n=1 Tax=Herbaspirillum lusitanum TaxID=213312 RepID=UPI002AA2ACE2|nr:Com family DNA-binding transcriptional regulator [Herbaspirillum lusitanum]
MQEMQEIRCGGCNKLLGKGEYKVISIKCPRCKTLNELRAMSPIPERQRASNTEGVHEQTNHPMGRRQAPSG